MQIMDYLITKGYGIDAKVSVSKRRMKKRIR